VEGPAASYTGVVGRYGGAGWSGQLIGLAAADALRWPVSLRSGVVVLAGFADGRPGLLL
jgi:hypothetical protein